MTTPVSNRPTTTTNSSVDSGDDVSTKSKSQTATEDNPPPAGATQVTSPEQLNDVSQAQINQAMRMSGNSPYVTLRTPDGTLLVVDKSLLLSWSFASPTSYPMGDSGDI